MYRFTATSGDEKIEVEFNTNKELMEYMEWKDKKYQEQMKEMKKQYEQDFMDTMLDENLVKGVDGGGH